MALTTLSLSSIVSATGWTGATTANLNTSDNTRATDGTAGELIQAQLGDTPSNFGNVNGNIVLRVEAVTVGTATRAKTILLELLDSGGAVLGSGSTGTVTTTEQTFTVTIGGRTDSKAVADGYQIRATVQEGGGMGDSVTVSIDLLNVDVNHSIAAPVFDLTAGFTGSGALTADLLERAVSTLTLELREGGVLRATRTWTPDGVTFPVTLSTGEKAAVVSWPDVEWWLIADGGRAIRVRRVQGLAPPPVAGPETFDLTAAFAGTGALAAAPGARKPLAAPLAGTGALGATPTRRADLSAALAGAGSLATALERLGSLVAAFGGLGALDATLGAQRPLTAAFDGSGVLVAVLGNQRLLVAPFAGLGDLAVVLLEVGGSATVDLVAAFTGGGELVATALRQGTVAAPFGGDGALDAALFRRGTVTAPFAGEGSLGAAVLRRGGITAPFTGTGQIDATPGALRDLTAAFDGDGLLAAMVLARCGLLAPFDGSGALDVTLLEVGGTAIFDLVAAFTGSGDVAVTLSARRPLVAPLTGSGDLTGAMLRAVPLLAAFTGTGNLAALLARRGTVLAPFAGAGDLATLLGRRGTLAAAFTGAGVLAAPFSELYGPPLPALEVTWGESGGYQIGLTGGYDAVFTTGGSG